MNLGLALQVDFFFADWIVKMSTFVYEVEFEERIPIHCCSVTSTDTDHVVATVLFQSTSGLFRRYCSTFTLATFWEVLLASFASFITSAYTLNHQDQVRFPELVQLQSLIKDQGFSFSRLSEDVSSETFDLESLDFLFDPSPALMLSCCLILGCSVSSFIYRRQKHDIFQTHLFLVVTGIATTLGVGMRVHSNLIMLALIPWALCFAMITSSLGHWLLRTYGRQRPKVLYEFDEREILIRKCWGQHVLRPHGLNNRRFPS